MNRLVSSDDAYGGIAVQRPASVNLLHDVNAYLPRGSAMNVLYQTGPGSVVPPMHQPHPHSLPRLATVSSDPAFSTDPHLNPHFAPDDHFLRPGGQRRINPQHAHEPVSPTQRVYHPRSPYPSAYPISTTSGLAHLPGSSRQGDPQEYDPYDSHYRRHDSPKISSVTSSEITSSSSDSRSSSSSESSPSPSMRTVLPRESHYPRKDAPHDYREPRRTSRGDYEDSRHPHSRSVTPPSRDDARIREDRYHDTENDPLAYPSANNVSVHQQYHASEKAPPTYLSSVHHDPYPVVEKTREPHADSRPRATEPEHRQPGDSHSNELISRDRRHREIDSHQSHPHSDRPSSQQKQNSTPGEYETQRPPLRDRAATTLAPPSAGDSPGLQRRYLDRIDELDESDPFNLKWHNGGRYEAITTLNPSAPRREKDARVTGDDPNSSPDAKTMPGSIYTPQQQRVAQQLYHEHAEPSYRAPQGFDPEQKREVNPPDPSRRLAAVLEIQQTRIEGSGTGPAPAPQHRPPLIAYAGWGIQTPPELPGAHDIEGRQPSISSSRSSSRSGSSRPPKPPSQYIPKQLRMPPLLYQAGPPSVSSEPSEPKLVVQAQTIPIADVNARNVLRKKTRKEVGVSLPLPVREDFAESNRDMKKEFSKDVRRRLSKRKTYT